MKAVVVTFGVSGNPFIAILCLQDLVLDRNHSVSSVRMKALVDVRNALWGTEDCSKSTFFLPK